MSRAANQSPNIVAALLESAASAAGGGVLCVHLGIGVEIGIEDNDVFDYISPTEVNYVFVCYLIWKFSYDRCG